MTGLAVLAALGSYFAGAGTPAFGLTSYVEAGTFGSFSNPQGVAVDQVSGDVYVLDAGSGTLHKFDAAGEPAEFSALASSVLEGVGGAGAGEDELAVDNSAGPTQGDIYIANGSHVGIYGSDGSSLGELTETAGHPWGEPCGVATDPAGKAYVGLYASFVNSYLPIANPVTNGDYAASIGGLNGICNIAADSHESVYAASWPEGPVTKYEASQFGSAAGSGTQIDARGGSLAVNPADDSVFIDEGNRVAEYDSSGKAILSFALAHSESYGVAISNLNGDLYVSDAATGSIDVFAPITVLQPVIDSASVSHVLRHGALLAGTLKPENGVAKYRFEYGTSTSYGSSTPAADAGTGAAEVPVSAQAISDLTPGATYHFRLVATNDAGTGVGADHTFSTEPGLTPVAVTGAAVVASQSAATLFAAIDPRGLTTSYTFEIGTEGGAYFPISGGLLSGTGAQSLSLPLTGLAPGATYRYRVVAANEDGVGAGADASFATPSYTFPLAVPVAPALLPPTPVSKAVPKKQPAPKKHRISKKHRKTKVRHRKKK